MHNPSTIEKNVMCRVRTISILRPFVSLGALSVLVAALALYGIGREVWVAKVFANGPQDFLGHFEYLFYAFTHTRVLVQALVFVTLAALVYLAQTVARSLALTLGLKTA